jgi:hypothetical protein
MWKEPTANILNMGTTVIPTMTINGVRRHWLLSRLQYFDMWCHVAHCLQNQGRRVGTYLTTQYNLNIHCYVTLKYHIIWLVSWLSKTVQVHCLVKRWKPNLTEWFMESHSKIGYLPSYPAENWLGCSENSLADVNVSYLKWNLLSNNTVTYHIILLTLYVDSMSKG